MPKLIVLGFLGLLFDPLASLLIAVDHCGTCKLQMGRHELLEVFSGERGLELDCYLAAALTCRYVAAFGL